MKTITLFNTYWPRTWSSLAHFLAFFSISSAIFCTFGPLGASWGPPWPTIGAHGGKRYADSQPLGEICESKTPLWTPEGHLLRSFLDIWEPRGSQIGPWRGPRAPCEGPHCSKVQFYQNVKIELSCRRELHFGGSGRGFWPSWAVGECSRGVLDAC